MQKRKRRRGGRESTTITCKNTTQDTHNAGRDKNKTKRAESRKNGVLFLFLQNGPWQETGGRHVAPCP